MKKIVCLLLALLILAGCTESTQPNIPDEPAKNKGGFFYDTCLLENGKGYAEYPEMTGLEGAKEDLSDLNRLIKEDACSPFGEEDWGYQGTFLACFASENLLTIEFYGTYEGADHNYTVHSFMNYRFDEAGFARVSLVTDDLLSALQSGNFEMPESEGFTSLWENQKHYITTHEVAKDDVTCALIDGVLYVAIAVPHTLYDVCIAIADEGLIA